MGILSDALDRHEREKETEQQVAQGEARPVSVQIPLPAEHSNKLVILSSPDSPEAESFKTLRSHLMFPSDRVRPRTIMVTSTFPGEGKTFVAANLAVSIALGIDEHVLLVDCDLRRSHVHKMFGYAESEGLHEYLVGKRDLAELLIRTKIDKLSLLPAGHLPHNPTELLSSARMAAFLTEVKDRYQDRFIVLDSTPSLVTAESNILAKFVDGIVLVVMAQRSPRKTIQRTLQNLGKEKILGVVFNGFRGARKDYNKYYQRYYRANPSTQD